MLHDYQRSEYPHRAAQTRANAFGDALSDDSFRPFRLHEALLDLWGCPCLFRSHQRSSQNTASTGMTRLTLPPKCRLVIQRPVYSVDAATGRQGMLLRCRIRVPISRSSSRPSKLFTCFSAFDLQNELAVVGICDLERLADLVVISNLERIEGHTEGCETVE